MGVTLSLKPAGNYASKGIFPTCHLCWGSEPPDNNGGSHVRSSAAYPDDDVAYDSHNCHNPALPPSDGNFEPLGAQSNEPKPITWSGERRREPAVYSA